MINQIYFSFKGIYYFPIKKCISTYILALRIVKGCKNTLKRDCIDSLCDIVLFLRTDRSIRPAQLKAGGRGGSAALLSRAGIA